MQRSGSQTIVIIVEQRSVAKSTVIIDSALCLGSVGLPSTRLNVHSRVATVAHSHMLRLLPRF